MKQYAKIEKAEIYALKIPFKMDFTHAMASRASSDSFILKIEGQGKRGFGEAIVRDYVTGEIGKGADLLENAKKIGSFSYLQKIKKVSQLKPVSY